ncbi:MAG TPA: extracellular solute-binding protein [Xanthobacteraceae bacterium]|jgi:iron(III) transport system substrate-binding protein
MFMGTWTAAALCGILSAAPALAADPALIAAAQREGQVTWYTTQITNQFGRPAMEAFQKQYGIRVNFVRADSIELAARMVNEAQAGRLQADVYDGTATAPVVKRAGLALKWLPERARQWPPEYRDPEGYWAATNLYVHTPAHNTNLVPKGSEPRAYGDLIDPRWKGRMAWATHATSSGALGFIGTVLAEFGEEPGKAYLRQLARQDIIQLGGSARTVTDQAIAGEYPVVLQIFNHQPVISARRGAPIEWIPMSPAMVVLCVTGVTKEAPHPNAGKLLVDFFVSDQGQKLFRDVDYIPVDPDVPPRETALRPDGKRFRGIFFSPEQSDAAMPHWLEVYNEIFR